MKDSPRENDGAIDRATAEAASRHLQLAKPTNPAVSSDEQGVPPTSGNAHGPNHDDPPNPDDPGLNIVAW
jgi:hypothetical protein